VCVCGRLMSINPAASLLKRIDGSGSSGPALCRAETNGAILRCDQRHAAPIHFDRGRLPVGGLGEKYRTQNCGGSVEISLLREEGCCVCRSTATNGGYLYV